MRLDNHISLYTAYTCSYRRIAAELFSRLDSLNKLRLHPFEQFILYQLLDNRLTVMLFKRSTSCISLEKVKGCRIVPISTYAVVNNPRL
jgi:hypothetical protein